MTFGMKTKEKRRRLLRSNHITNLSLHLRGIHTGWCFSCTDQSSSQGKQSQKVKHYLESFRQLWRRLLFCLQCMLGVWVSVWRWLWACGAVEWVQDVWTALLLLDFLFYTRLSCRFSLNESLEREVTDLFKHIRLPHASPSFHVPVSQSSFPV